MELRQKATLNSVIAQAMIMIMIDLLWERQQGRSHSSKRTIAI